MTTYDSDDYVDDRQCIVNGIVKLFEIWLGKRIDEWEKLGQADVHVLYPEDIERLRSIEGTDYDRMSMDILTLLDAYEFDEFMFNLLQARDRGKIEVTWKV